MEKFHSKGLKFQCDQRIENMKTLENGFHCGQCNRELIDFRNKSKKEYEAIKKRDGGGCGVFYDYQVNDEFDIKINYQKPLWFTAVLGGLMLSTPTKAQEPTHNEIIKVDSLNSYSTDTTEKIDLSSNKTCHSETIKEHKKPHRNRKKLFVSRRFPFIHYKRRIPINAVGFW